MGLLCAWGCGVARSLEGECGALIIERRCIMLGLLTPTHVLQIVEETAPKADFDRSNEAALNNLLLLEERKKSDPTTH
jgi:hypothetical protein